MVKEMHGCIFFLSDNKFHRLCVEDDIWHFFFKSNIFMVCDMYFWCRSFFCTFLRFKDWRDVYVTDQCQSFDFLL